MTRHRTTMVDRIMEIMRTFHDGATCDDIEVLTSGKHQTCSARLWHLRNDGVIIDSGRRRATRSGHDAIVWTIPSFLPMGGNQ